MSCSGLFKAKILGLHLKNFFFFFFASLKAFQSLWGALDRKWSRQFPCEDFPFPLWRKGWKEREGNSSHLGVSLGGRRSPAWLLAFLWSCVFKE